jgi:hypothetical protein
MDNYADDCRVAIDSIESEYVKHELARATRRMAHANTERQLTRIEEDYYAEAIGRDYPR